MCIIHVRIRTTACSFASIVELSYNMCEHCVLSWYLPQVYEHFGKKDPPPASLGKTREWNVDIVPKFLMASGKFDFICY